MWVLVFLVFLVINSGFYFIFIKHSDKRLINWLFIGLFIGSLAAFALVENEFLIVNFFHPMLPSFMYYIFLILSLFDFSLFHKERPHPAHIKRGIRILMGLVCSILSANIYTASL